MPNRFSFYRILTVKNARNNRTHRRSRKRWRSRPPAVERRMTSVRHGPWTDKLKNRARPVRRSGKNPDRCSRLKSKLCNSLLNISSASLNKCSASLNKCPASLNISSASLKMFKFACFRSTRVSRLICMKCAYDVFATSGVHLYRYCKAYFSYSG